jgi:MFS family permease
MLTSGISTALVGVFINEISPIGSRGSYGSINQLSIVLGALSSQVAGIVFVDDWRTLFLLTIFPAILQLLFVRSLPESARWLLKNVGRDEAFHALARLRNGSAEIEFEALCADNSDVPSMSLGDIFRAEELRVPLASVFLLQIAQQASGINVGTYYSTSIFEKEYPLDVAIKLSLLLCVFISSATLFSLFLIDRLGRKTLLLVSMGGMAAAACAVGGSGNTGGEGNQIVIWLLAFVFSFGLGLGSIPWYELCAYLLGSLSAS